MQNSIKISFRFQVKQTGPSEIEIEIERGPNGQPIIDPEVAGFYKLSEAEYAEAEIAALRAIAIIK